jgi:hypothetical protein
MYDKMKKNASVWMALAFVLALVGWEAHASDAPGPRANIEDLGVFTTHSMIMLEKCERRKDFFNFKIEVLPRNLRGWTNRVTIVTTNSSLTMDDLAAVPEGVAIMGIRSMCADSTYSPVRLYRIDVQRDPPSAPTARKVEILHNPAEQKIEHIIQNMEASAAVSPPPPMPAGMTNSSPVPLRTHAQPLPGGTNESYAQHQFRLEQAMLKGYRRSQ